MLTIFNKQNSNKASDVESNLKPMTLESAKEYYKAVDISTVKNRTPAIVVGKVISTRLVPMAKSFWFEVIIDDNTGKIDGWFFGRKEIKGMGLGSIILMKGLAPMDNGEMTIANPYYQIL